MKKLMSLSVALVCGLAMRGTGQIEPGFQLALAASRRDQTENADAPPNVLARQLKEAQQQRDSARRELYLADVQLAGHAMEASDLTLTRHLLKRHIPLAGEPDMRGPEWYYVKAWSDSFLTLPGSRAMGWSPDGRRLAVAGKVWDAVSGVEISTLNASDRWGAVAWSADGKRLATAIEYHSDVKIWDTETWQQVHEINIPDRVNSLAWSPVSNRLACASQDKPTRVWDATTWQEIATLYSNQGWLVNWSPDGKRIASAGAYRALKVWDATTWEEVLTLSDNKYHAASFAWSPDSQRLIAATRGWGWTVCDAATGEEILYVRDQAGDVTSVAWSPDGQQVAVSAGDQPVRIWDATTGQQRRTIDSHTGTVTLLAWSPDGQRLAALNEQQLIVCPTNPVAVGRVLHGHKIAVQSASWSPDGRLLVSLSADNTAKVWDVSARKEQATLSGYTGGAIAWCRDGSRLASASEKITVWDAMTGQAQRTISEVAGSIAWRSDEDRLAVTTGRDLLKTFDPNSGKELSSVRANANDPRFPGWSITAWSPDGQRVASTTRPSHRYPANVYVFSAETGRGDLAVRAPSFVGSMAWCPDGRRLACTTTMNPVQIWPLSGDEMPVLLRGTTAIRGEIAMQRIPSWSPDGRRLALSRADKSVTVWDTATGLEILTMRTVSDVSPSPSRTAYSWSSMGSIAWSPDGRSMAVCESDGTIELWGPALDGNSKSH